MKQALWVLGAVLLAAEPAAAGGPAWGYRMTSEVPAGQKAALTLTSANDAHDIRLTLKPERGRPLQFKLARLRAGSEHRFEFKSPVGVSSWSAKLTGTADGQTTTAEFQFEVAVLAPLDVRLRQEDVDLPGGRVVVVPNRALKSAEIEAWDKTGQRIVQTSVDLTGSIAGQPTVVEWINPDGVELRRVDLKLFDEFGMWAGQRAVSWHANVDHEEVVFETAKWDLRAEETPKMDRAIVELNRELDRFREELGRDASVTANFYVAGYTDTVGKNGDNQALSERRAQSLAGYFRDHGVKVPVYYQGFGESAPAVETEDDVDEARNRRAMYILGTSPPSGPPFPKRNWKRLN